MTERPILENAEQVLEAGLELDGILFPHLSIELKAPPTHSEVDSADTTTVEAKSRLTTRHAGAKLFVRFDYFFDAPTWEARVAVEARYVAERDFDLAEAVDADFATKVALGIMFPYVREALSSLTARATGSAVLVPILRLDNVTYDKL